MMLFATTAALAASAQWSLAAATGSAAPRFDIDFRYAQRPVQYPDVDTVKVRTKSGQLDTHGGALLVE